MGSPRLPSSRNEKPRRANYSTGLKKLEHETGFEPATSTLATFLKSPKSLRIPARKPQGAAPSRICGPVWARSGHAAPVALLGARTPLRSVGRCGVEPGIGDPELGEFRHLRS